MGAVVGPPKIRMGKRKKIIEDITQDLDSANIEAVIRLYENWRGKNQKGS